MSLWDADYFKMKTIKAQKTWEETDLPFNRLKKLDRGPVSGITRDIGKEYGLRVVGESYRPEATLHPIVSAWPANIYLPNISFPISTSLQSPKPLPPASSFVSS